MAHTVGTKGQVVIEKAIRDRLGVGPGWQALQVLADDHVCIYFIPPPHRRSLRGVLASQTASGELTSATEEQLHAAREAAWREAGCVKMARGTATEGDPE